MKNLIIVVVAVVALVIINFPNMRKEIKASPSQQRPIYDKFGDEIGGVYQGASVIRTDLGDGKRITDKQMKILEQIADYDSSRYSIFQGAYYNYTLNPAKLAAYLSKLK